MLQPDYCCAVIEDQRGWLLLQLRPAGARHAPDQLTCFGGRREPGEDADQCLRRELAEELGWAPPPAPTACALWQGEQLIAWFSRARFPGGSVVTEPGHVALWAPWSALPGLPLSPWHRTVLTAIAKGRRRVDLG
ncbi:MAG: NUDIX domain-containing protein [Planctomycetes bacterium]|nr:NUDIX domain-containing protein [Planctomycetota bacterium]